MAELGLTEPEPPPDKWANAEADPIGTLLGDPTDWTWQDDDMLADAAPIPRAWHTRHLQVGSLALSLVSPFIHFIPDF